MHWWTTLNPSGIHLVPLCILCCLMWPCKVGFIVNVALCCFVYVITSTIGQRLFQEPPPCIAHRREKYCRSSVQHCTLQVKRQTALVGPLACIPRPTQPVLFGSKSGSVLFEARSLCRLDRTFFLRPRKQYRIYVLYCLQTSHAFSLCVQL